MRQVRVDLSHVNWRLLRRQKLALLNVVNEAVGNGEAAKANRLRGLVHLLDHIQDRAAETLGERFVFGKRWA